MWFCLYILLHLSKNCFKAWVTLEVSLLVEWFGVMSGCQVNFTLVQHSLGQWDASYWRGHVVFLCPRLEQVRQRTKPPGCRNLEWRLDGVDVFHTRYNRWPIYLRLLDKLPQLSRYVNIHSLSQNFSHQAPVVLAGFSTWSPMKPVKCQLGGALIWGSWEGRVGSRIFRDCWVSIQLFYCRTKGCFLAACQPEVILSS
jgi:hypothetical protein